MPDENPPFLELTIEIARLFAACPDRSFLTRYETLGPEAARVLAGTNHPLDLDRMTALSVEDAVALATHNGPLFLDAIKHLSSECARHLSAHSGYLSLSGIATMTDEMAAAFSTHKGVLILDGLTELTDRSAKLLARHQGPLSLFNLYALSDSALESLLERTEVLSLGDPALTVKGTEMLREADPETIRIEVPGVSASRVGCPDGHYLCHYAGALAGMDADGPARISIGIRLDGASLSTAFVNTWDIIEHYRSQGVIPVSITTRHECDEYPDERA